MQIKDLKKIMAEKKTENGDIAYNTTGNNLIDLLFMADFFTKNLDAVHLGSSDKEKLFAMYMRDPRFGQGRRDLGRRLMQLAEVDADHVVLAGRYDDLWHNPTTENIEKLVYEICHNNQLAKKWMPRLTGKDKKMAKALAELMKLSEREYRQLIKATDTTEYKLSYAVEKTGTLEEIMDDNNKIIYEHPLVDTIDFEKVPSLAMLKYMNAFARRPDTSERFQEYIEKVKNNKAKIHTATANVHDAYKAVNNTEASDIADVVGNKIIEKETDGLSLNCICVLDTSGSMGSIYNPNSLCARAVSVAYAIATNSTYAKNKVIAFSSNPHLMTIRGKTLKERYMSMYSGDYTNTNLGAVFHILMQLDKFPEYVIVMSDMEFDNGSYFNYAQWKRLVKEKNAPTKLIWWNFNDRHRTVPEYDADGNIYLSGYHIQALLQLPGVINMEEYIDKILEDYASKIA